MYDEHSFTPAVYLAAAAELAARAAGETDPAARLDYRRRAVARLDVACLLAATPPTQCRRATAPGAAGQGQGQGHDQAAAGSGAGVGSPAEPSAGAAVAPPEKRLATQSLLPQDLIAMLQDAIRTPKTPRREDRGTANSRFFW